MVSDLIEKIWDPRPKINAANSDQRKLKKNKRNIPRSIGLKPFAIGSRCFSFSTHTGICGFHQIFKE